MRWRIFLIVVALAAAALHGYTATVQAEGGLSVFTALLFIWSVAPYVLAVVFGMRFDAVGASISAAAMLFVDGWMFRSAFIVSSASTAALGLLFAPLWNLVIVLPGALLVCWAIRRATRKRAG
jgi:hypothetical protein